MSGDRRLVNGILGLALLVLCVTGCASTSKPSSTKSDGADLAMDRANVKSEGRVLEVAWHRNNFGGAKVRYLGNDGQILIAQTDDDAVHALGRDGVHRWISYDIHDRITEPPVANSWGVALLAGSDTFVFDRVTGNLTLKKHLPVPPSAVPVMSDSTLFVPTFVDYQLRTFDLDSGLSGWSYRTAEGVTAAPVIIGTAPKTSVVLAGLDGGVAAVPAVSASGFAPDGPSWRRATYGSNTAGLVTDGATVYVASEDTKVYALDGVTGQIRWSYPTGEILDRTPTLFGGALYVFAGGQVLALDASNGALLWSFGSKLKRDAFVAGAGGRVYVYDGKALHQVDPKGGSVYRTFEVRGSHVAAFQAAGLLISADSKGVTAYRL